MKRIGTLLLVLVSSFAAASAAAQSYPTRPVRMVVPFGAGGPTDISARVIVDPLSKRLGQPVLVENRPGSFGILGIEHVLKEPADGYTVCFVGGLPGYPTFYQAWTQDLLGGVGYVGAVGYIPTLLLASPKFGPSNAREFVEYAKANRGKVFYPEVGAGSFQMAMANMNKIHDLNLQAVQYKSSGEAKLAALRGDLTVYLDGLPSAIGDLKSGTLKALAIMGPTRVVDFPNVPTIGESMPDLRLDFHGMLGLIAPPGLPPAVQSRLSSALVESVRSPEFAAGAAKIGLVPSPLSSAEFRDITVRELEFLTRLAKQIGVQKR